MIFLESVGSRASLSAERDAKASLFLFVNQQVVMWQIEGQGGGDTEK
jgi:hypothetical protein